MASSTHYIPYDTRKVKQVVHREASRFFSLAGRVDGPPHMSAAALCPRRLVLRQRSFSELDGVDDLLNISLGRAYWSSDWYLADGLFVSLAAEELLVLLLGLDEGLLEEVGV